MSGTNEGREDVRPGGGGAPDDPRADAEREALEGALGGRYQVVRRLGRGAFGAVYLAREPILHRTVAVKVLRLEHARDPRERERFRLEARTGAQLVHPGVVPLLTYGEADDLLYIVMPYVSGESLGARLARQRVLPSDEVRRLLADLALSLEFAHRLGVVHRDIKPENVLLTNDGAVTRALLADFGVAAFPNRDPGVGATRESCGSPPFMSPEQALAEADVDGRSDIYAIGVLGYIMLAGTAPPSGVHPHEALAAAAPGAHPDLVAAIARCLEFEPARRWPRASALRSALLQGSMTGAVRRPPRASPPPPAAPRSPSRAASLLSRLAGVVTGRSRRVAGTVADDVRQTVRGLRKAPGFTAAAVVTLALGIGVNATIFSVIDAVLLRPLPFAEPERIVRVYETLANGRGIGSVSAPNFRD